VVRIAPQAPDVLPPPEEPGSDCKVVTRQSHIFIYSHRVDSSLNGKLLEVENCGSDIQSFKASNGPFFKLEQISLLYRCDKGLRRFENDLNFDGR